jgi:hypothetical protein
MSTICVPKRLANWELGDLVGVEPSLIVRDENDHVGRFMIRLALAFNDLKGMIMLDQYRVAFTPVSLEEVTPQSGQFGGLIVMVHRYIGGILNEALNVIDDEPMAMADGETTGLLASLPRQTQEFWKSIIAEATNSRASGNQSNRAMLARLRNKVSFHYDGEKLCEAFREYFSGSPRHERNALAYYSSGIDMDATRYYFADAAAHADYTKAGTERGKKTDVEVVTFAHNVNDAFAQLLNAFLSARAANARVPQATLSARAANARVPQATLSARAANARVPQAPKVLPARNQVRRPPASKGSKTRPGGGG